MSDSHHDHHTAHGNNHHGHHHAKAAKPGIVIFALIGCFAITLASQLLLTNGGEIERPAMGVHAPVVDGKDAVTLSPKEEHTRHHHLHERRR